MALCATGTTNLQAGEQSRSSKDDVPVASTPEKGRWSLTLGVNARQIRSDFHLGAPRRSLLETSASRGLGDVGLYQDAKGESTLFYEDGVIVAKNAPGLADVAVDKLSQFRSASPYFGVEDPDARDAFVDFHSHGESITGGSFSRTDEQTKASPVITLRYQLLQKPGFSIGLLGQYSWTGSSHNSGWGKVGERTTSLYTYTYRGAQLKGDFDSQFSGIAVFDAAKAEPIFFNSALVAAPSLAPTKSVARSVTPVRSRASLDVNLHELVLGFELTKDVGDRVHLFASVGPALDLVDWRLTTETRVGGTSFKKTASNEAFKVGVAAQGGISFDVDRDKLWAVEIHGGYNYTDKVGVSADNASAKIDVSSWVAGIGITRYFGAGPESLPADDSGKGGYKNKVVMEPAAEKSRWSVTAGVNARRIKSDFHISAPSLRSVATDASRGLGDVGLYKENADRIPLVYEDGRIVGQFPGQGDAYVKSLNQIRPAPASGTTDGEERDVFVDFHSRGESLSPGSFNRSDEQVTASPVITLRYELLQKPGYSLGVLGQYSWTGTSHDSGLRQVAARTTSGFTYSYRAHQNVRLDPGETGNTPFSLYRPEVIFDPVLASTAPGADETFPSSSFTPTKSVKRTVTPVRSRASLDVDLHEFVLGFEFTKDLGDRVHLFASVGPSFELVDWHLRTETRAGGKTWRSSAADEAFKIGVATQGGISVDLDQAKRWSVEVHGGYNYTDKVSVGSDNAKAKIDVASWVAGGGLTWHF